MHRRAAGRTFLVVAVVFTLLALPAAAWAFIGLPANGARVDDDPAAGIDPGQDAGVVDAVGGSLVAGGPAVPWAIFQHETAAETQVFVRAFKNGAWITQGTGTVNGASSAAPRFTGSLNFAQDNEAEDPSIDFAGPGRTVPWATWYEDHIAPFGKQEIVASRFDQTTGKWVFAGQGRPGTGGPPVLNIDPTKNAEAPVVIGGATVAGANPGPWVTWQEQGPVRSQIFVVKPIGPGTVTCPPGTKPVGGNAVGGFCWQQVGLERSGTLPTLNVDPSRNGIEPDMAFTGPGDTVPWVVWYETGTGRFGVRNERVFAAKAVADPTADGGFSWAAVGKATSAPQRLDTSAGGAGACLASKDAENACALNSRSKADAEDPRVAAGTMTPGQPTVPWVVWSEQVHGAQAIFVARLVNGTHFQIVNGGKPVSAKGADAIKPDIGFSRTTPYVTWHQKVGKTVRLFVGHLRGAANPRFVFDARKGVAASQRGLTLASPSPISSSCTANPFNGDGSACQGGASGQPFFLFNDGAPGARRILARAIG